VDRIDHLPPALALRQRPPVPGPRSTVGTMSEVLNVLRLMMSRLGSHLCPNGHRVEPSIATRGMEIICPVCGVHFEPPSAERPEALTSQQPTICCAAARIASAAARIPGGACLQGDSRLPRPPGRRVTGEIT
jgi:hypothetical protein